MPQHADKVRWWASVIMCYISVLQRVFRHFFQEFSLDLVIRQSWTDPRLNHSLSYPIILLGASKELIWLPDTFFLNVRSATLHDVISENSKVSIRPGGHVIYSTRYFLMQTTSQNLPIMVYGHQLFHIVKFFFRAICKGSKNLL